MAGSRGCCWPLLLLFLVFPSAGAQQLSNSESRAVFRLKRILEYPPALDNLNRYTNLCYLPPSPSLSVVCSGNRITELSISGGAGSRLSPTFSVDALFTTLSRLPSLAALSLVSLGLWGPLPPKVDRFPALLVLNLSSNLLAGPIPREISTMASLRSLVLRGNRLNGTVPDLTPLPALEEVDLGGNLLGPDLPNLARDTVVASLGGNAFRDRISPALQALTKLQRLDLSSNQLTGTIPAFLFSLPAIRILDLSRNLFVASLPGNLSCGGELQRVDMSGNRLVGTLPACLRASSSGTVVLDSWNCLSPGESKDQHKSSYCNEGAIAAAVPPAGKKGSPFRNKLGFVLGVVGGVLGAAAVLGMVLIFVLKRAKGGNADVSDTPKPQAAGKAQGSSFLPAGARRAPPAVRLGPVGLLPCRVFTREELEEATNNFNPSNLIQKDSGRQMYKGWLNDGSAIVVRPLKLKQKYPAQSVAQFVDVISKLRHQHLVSILGHCIDDDAQDSVSSHCVYLVLEYVSNGTLRSHLTEWRKCEMLKWPQRVAAVMGVARGIQFLHTVVLPGISGNNLNIETILLDVRLTAKIGNYNLPMLSKNENNKVCPESPFVPNEDENPVCACGGDRGEKEDIYQLGLILFEVITGKPVTNQDELEAMRDQLQKSLMGEPEGLRESADPTIHGTYAYDSLRTAVELALSCVSNDPSGRPTIDDVLWNLQYSVQVQEGWACSENLSTSS